MPSCITMKIVIDRILFSYSLVRHQLSFAICSLLTKLIGHWYQCYIDHFLPKICKILCCVFRDPDFLREFYASQSADKSKCDSTGWMMVSTANRCFLEAAKKPAFYYAPGQTAAHWGFSKYYFV